MASLCLLRLLFVPWAAPDIVAVGVSRVYGWSGGGLLLRYCGDVVLRVLLGCSGKMDLVTEALSGCLQLA